jgi:hypothetical protein
VKSKIEAQIGLSTMSVSGHCIYATYHLQINKTITIIVSDSVAIIGHLNQFLPSSVHLSVMRLIRRSAAVFGTLLMLGLVLLGITAIDPRLHAVMLERDLILFQIEQLKTNSTKANALQGFLND